MNFRDDPEHPLGFLTRKCDELMAQRQKIQEDYEKAVGEIDAKVASLDLAKNVLREQYDPEFIADDWIEPDFAELGMTDRIRCFLCSSPRKSFTPKLVRDLLVADRFNLKGRSNPMAEIHTVLKRLVDSGEAQEVLSATKAKAYRWANPEGLAVKEPQAS